MSQLAGVTRTLVIPGGPGRPLRSLVHSQGPSGLLSKSVPKIEFDGTLPQLVNVNARRLREGYVEEQRPVWVQPARITGIVMRSGGGYLVTIRSTTVRFAARNLNQREVVRDLTRLIIMSNEDTDLVYYTVELESLPDHVQIGNPVMVEVDEEDDHVIHLHPDALYQEPYLPDDMYLYCPVEHEGRWRRQGDEAVYECPCGAIWDISPEEGKEKDGI